MVEQHSGLGNWYDYGARWYDASIGRWGQVDPISEKYFGWSPYCYTVNTPINAFDPDGNLVVFINGNEFSSSIGTERYWRLYRDQITFKRTPSQWLDPGESRKVPREIYAFDKHVMRHIGDYNAIYRDGSLGGWAPFAPSGNVDAGIRFNYGYSFGARDAKMLIDQLKRVDGHIVETIKIITHSMGGAYGKGYAKAILDYAKEKEIEGVTIAFIADFAPFQPSQLEAVTGANVGPNLQFSHSRDFVAGNAPIKGAKQMDTSDDKGQGHSIFDFINQISKLPAGSYRVVDGEIIPNN